MSIHDLIEKHSLDLTDEVDLVKVRADLLRDARRFIEGVQVRIKHEGIVLSTDDPDIKDIVETYSRVYPEVSFLFEVN